MRACWRWVCLIFVPVSIITLCYPLWHLLDYLRGESVLRNYFITASELELEGSSNSDSFASERGDSKGTGAAKVVPENIPRILHQTYRSTSIPPTWLNAQASCQNLHRSNWTHMFWTDQEAQEFLATNYPWFLSSYLSYPYNIQRADAIRYFLLYHFGGFYLDLDVGCKKELSPLLRFDAVFPKTAPTGVSNDVMGATKHHPFFKELIQSLPSSNHIWGTKYLTVFLSTGPIFVNYRLVRFLRVWTHHKPVNDQPNDIDLKTPSAPLPVHHSPGVRILPPELYGSTPTSFFAHYPGSSWHGNDARVVRYLARYKYPIAFVLATLAICAYFTARFCKPRLVLSSKA